MERVLHDFDGGDRFEIRRRLGAGGMGVVYEAFDRELKGLVALKTLRRTSPEAVLRLKSEFRALQDLRHPNLITLGELFERDGQWFYSMELVRGADLLSYVRSGPDAPDGPGDPGSTPSGTHPGTQERSPVGPSVGVMLEPGAEERLRRAFAGLAEGLSCLHASGRVHRDIKPTNVLVTREGRVVIMDFGLVLDLRAGEESTHHAFPLGTVSYMAPEQAAQLPAGPAADWYSLGVMLYEALTGQAPHQGTALQLVMQKQRVTPPRPREQDPRIPEDLDVLAMDLLVVEPTARPSGAAVIQRLLGDRRSDTPASAAAPEDESPFVGRHAELAFLQSRWQGLLAGRPASVLLHGQSGVGKSELVRRFLGELRAAADPPILLPGRCYERESVPYKAFDGMMDALARLLRRMPADRAARVVPRHAAMLVRAFPALGRVRPFQEAPPAREEGLDPHEIQLLVFQAFRDLLARLAQLQPLVIALDDVQWADDDSRRLLRALLAPPEAPRMLLIVAIRTPADPEAAAALVQGVRELLPGESSALALAPLSAEESIDLARLIVATPGRAADPATLEQVARESAGHPLLLLELARHVSGAVSEASGQAVHLDAVLAARIARLEPTARDVLSLVTTAGRPLRIAVAAAASGLDPAELQRCLGLLRSDRLLSATGGRNEDLVEAYHDRVRETAYAHLGSDERRQLHRRLAVALEAAGDAQSEALAVHFLGAGDEARASHLAEKASAEATAAFAYDRAARLAAWARKHSPASDPRRRPLTVRLADALAASGRGREAAHAYLEAVPGALTAEALDLRRRAADQLLVSGYIDEGIAVTESVMAEIGLRLPRTPLGSLLSLLYRRMRLRIRGIHFRPRDVTQVAPEHLVQIDLLGAISRGFGIVDNIRASDLATRWLIRALRIGEPHRILRAMSMELCFLAGVGSGGSRYYRRLSARFDELVAQWPDAAATPIRDYSVGIAHFMAGRWTDAAAVAREVDGRIGQVPELRWESQVTRFFRVWSLFYLGQLAEMEQLVLPWASQADDQGNVFAASGYKVGLGNLALLNALGPAAARRAADEFAAAWSVHGYHLQHYYVLLARVHIDLYEDEGARALARIEAEHPRAKSAMLLMMPVVNNELIHLRARAALSAAEHAPPGRREALIASARKDGRRLIKTGLSSTLAMGEMVLAAVAHQQGRADEAVARLTRGLETLDSLQMGLFAAAARCRLATLLPADAGEPLRTEGMGFLAAQRTRNPAAMIRLFAPGFGEPGGDST